MWHSCHKLRVGGGQQLKPITIMLIVVLAAVACGDDEAAEKYLSTLTSRQSIQPGGFNVDICDSSPFFIAHSNYLFIS